MITRVFKFIAKKNYRDIYNYDANRFLKTGMGAYMEVGCTFFDFPDTDVYDKSYRSKDIISAANLYGLDCLGEIRAKYKPVGF